MAPPGKQEIQFIVGRTTNCLKWQNVGECHWLFIGMGKQGVIRREAVEGL